MKKNNFQFLDSIETQTSYQNSKIVIVPAPLEKTVSYGKGTSLAPDVIINASAYLELFDEELKCEPIHHAIFTGAPLSNDMRHETFLEFLKDTITEIIHRNKKPVVIGGEHSLSISPIKAIHNTLSDDFSVLHLDAHTDFRDTYEDTKLSHACVMRRVHELNVPIISIGIRSLSDEEHQFMSRINHPIYFAGDIIRNPQLIDDALSLLNKNIYITLDIDVFDPTVISQTGTPEPGGLGWYAVLDIIKKISDLNLNVMGFDVVEFAPDLNDRAQSFTCAKLIYKMMSYFWRNNRD